MVSGKTYGTFGWLSAVRDTGTAASFHEEYRSRTRHLIETMFEYERIGRNPVPFYYEQFDNLARQIYVAEVKFTKSPALNIEWYPIVNDRTTNKSTNGKWVARTYDVASAIADLTPSSAKIAVANISANRSVVLSEDGGSNYPMIFGRVIDRSEVENIVRAEDKYGQFAFGVKRLEINPSWVTNRAAAENIAEWSLEFSGAGVEEHRIKIFSNHFVELGDIVTLSYNKKGIPTTAKFVVKEKSTSWTNGLDTEIVAVRVS